MTLHKFNLPDVGEGLTEAEIVAWKVKPGDTVAINDVLCEIETAKSLVELPSPFAGTVTELLVAEGLTVDVGTAIISVTDAQAAAGAPAPKPTAPEPTAPDAPLYGTLAEDTLDAVESDGRPAAGPLVGSGPKADAVKRRRRVAPPAARQA
ncbi:biotin/lipoyl-containing protein, partial [Arthrobacter sp. ES1]